MSKDQNSSPCVSGDLPPICKMMLGSFSERLDEFERKMFNGITGRQNDHEIRIKLIEHEGHRRLKLVTMIQTIVLSLVITGSASVILHFLHEYMDAQSNQIRSTIQERGDSR